MDRSRERLNRGDEENDPLLNGLNEEDFVSAEELSDEGGEVAPSVAGPSQRQSKLPPHMHIEETEYTQNEKYLIESLRGKFPQFKDEKLYRFLFARGFDLAKTEVMLHTHVEWRAKHNLDNLTFSKAPLPTRGFFCNPDSNGEGGDAEVQNLLKYNGAVVHKFSKAGLPLVIYRAVRSFPPFCFSR